jgi:hypothetical protein
VYLRGGSRNDDLGTRKHKFNFKAACNMSSSNAQRGEQSTESVKDALFQLTTQIFSSKSGPTADYYEVRIITTAVLPSSILPDRLSIPQVLGVDKKATMKQIRDGYYKAAKQWHPDKNTQDPQAEARFKLISEAYEVTERIA